MDTKYVSIFLVNTFNLNDLDSHCTYYSKKKRSFYNIRLHSKILNSNKVQTGNIYCVTGMPWHVLRSGPAGLVFDLELDRLELEVNYLRSGALG